MKNLEVGDIIFKRHYNSVYYVGKIDRVTNTIAFVGKQKFKRERRDSEKSITQIPYVSYGAWYFIPDKKDIEEYNKQRIKTFVENFNYSKLSDDDLSKVYEIIKSQK